MTLSPNTSYGVTQFSDCSFVSDILLRKGYFTATFSDETLWNNIATELLSVSHSSDHQIKSGNWRAPLVNNMNMLRLATHEQMLDIVTQASPFIDLNQQNVVYTNCEHGQDRWHRDIPYQDWVPNGIAAINILFSFSNQTKSSPALEIIEGSHITTSFPCDESIPQLSQIVNLGRYEFLVMNSFLLHRAPSSSADSVLVNHVFAPKIFQQQIDLNSHSNKKAIVEHLKLLGIHEGSRVAGMLGLDRKTYE